MPASKKYISEKVKKTKQFIDEDIWNLDLESFSRMKARLIREAQTIIVAIRNFSKLNLGLRATALSFFTTMSLIPFVAVVFSIANKAGFGSYLKSLLFDAFEDDELLVRVLSFADNIIATAHGPYGMVSFLLFVWLVIWLFISVETAFNTIWKVQKQRNIIKRSLAYLGVIVASPFIIVAVISVSLSATNAADYINGVPVLAYTKDLFIWIVFFILVAAALFVCYKFIPNAKVKIRSAVISAIIAALAFTAVQYVYVETQVFVSRLSAVYGVFAAVPLFMVWVNIAWYIVIVGADVSYALQNVDNNDLIKKTTYHG